MKSKILLQIAVAIAAMAIVFLGADASSFSTWMVTKVIGAGLVVVSLCVGIVAKSYGPLEVEE